MSLSPPGAQRGWRLADVAKLPDDEQRYELVDGGLIVTPPASQRHQDLSHALRQLCEQAAPVGWRCRVDYPLPFADDSLRVPDLLVFRWPLQHRRADARNPVGPADVGLLVEVVSPSTRRTDRFAKPGEYAEAGIPLFWRLEPEPELVLAAFVLLGNGYAPAAEVRARGVAPVPWGELELDVGLLGA